MRKRFAIGLVGALVIIGILVARRHEVLRFAFTQAVGLATGYHVELKDQHLGFSHGALIGVRITSGGEPLLEAERVDVSYSLRDLLPGSTHRFGLLGVTIDRPHLTIVRHKDGSYNLHIPAPSGGGPIGPQRYDAVPYRLTVRIRNGGGDLRAPYVNDPSARSIGVTGITLDATIDTSGRTSYVLRGAFTEAAPEPFVAKGVVDVARGYAMHHVQASQIPLRAIGNYIINSRAADILAGNASSLDLRAYALGVTPNAPPEYHLGAKIDVSDASLRIVGLAVPLAHLHTRLELVDDTLFAKHLDATLAGIPVHGSGGLFDFSNVQYRLGVSGRGDLARLRRAFTFAHQQPVSGSTQLGLLIEGGVDGPLLAIDADATHAAYRSIALDDLHARVGLYQDVLYVAPLHAHTGGADILVGGTLALGDPLVSKLVVHATAPADRFPYAGELLGTEPIVADAIGDGSGGAFHVRAAVASVRGVDRAAGLAVLEPDGEIAVSPFWMRTERGEFDASYALDRKTQTSAFWVAARDLQLTAPHHAAFTGSTVSTLPAITTHIDSANFAGGGPDGTDALLAGTASMHAMTVAGVRIDRLSASFAGRLAGASIDALSAQGPWGEIAGRGAFSMKSLLVDGTYRGPLGGLRRFIGNMPAQGEVAGTAALSIAPNRVIVQAQQLHSQDATVHGMALRTLSGTAVIDRGVLHVYAAHAELAGGDLVAAGTYAKGARGLQLIGTNLDADGLHHIGLPLDAGRVAVDGEIAPGGALPRFAGGITLAHGHTRGYAVDGSGEVTLAGTSVMFANTLADLNGAYAYLHGSVGNLTSGTPTYAFRADLPAADLSRSLRTLHLPTARSTGTYNANIAIGGTGLYPTVSGPVNVPGGSINGLPFVDAHAMVTANRSGLHMREGGVHVGTTAARFGAAITPAISGIDVRAPDANLGDFNNFFDTGDTLAGTGLLRFNVVSHGHRLSSNANVNISAFRYRNLPIGDTRAVWTTNNGVANGELRVGGSEGLLRAHGSIALVPAHGWENVVERSRYNIDLDVSDLDLSLWVAALGFPQIPVTGRVDANGDIVGTYPQLVLKGKADLKKGTIGHFPLDDFTIALHSDARRLQIDSATLQAPGLTATAQGSLGFRPYDPLDIAVRATSSDAPRLIGMFTGHPVDLEGAFEVNASAKGTYRSPELTASLRGQNVSYRGINAQSLFGSLRLNGGALELSDAGLDFGKQGSISASGSMPFELDPLAIGPSDAPIHLTLQAKGLNPSILDVAFGSRTQLDGSIDGTLGITGIVSNPKISGRFGISNGSYVSALESVPITKTVATLTFDRTSATVDDLRAQLGTGEIRGHGSASFGSGFGKGEGPTFDLEAVASDAQLDLPSYGSGTVNGTLALKRSATVDTMLDGAVTLTNATLPLAVFLAAADKSGSAAGTPLKLGFDVKLSAGKNVRVRGSGYGAGLDIGATGAVTLAGTMAAPTLDGRFTSTGGTLTYFDRAFRVQDGSVSFKAENGVTPTLHAVGTTHVVNADPDLARNPYGAADITIKVDGQLANLKIAFASDPPGYSRDQIIGMIAPFGGFVGGIAYNQATAVQSLPGTLPTVGAPLVQVQQANGTITVGQEAFNVLNAQFASGLLSPIEGALGQNLGLSSVNLNLDYGGNFGVSARKVLGKTVSFIYATTFGIPTRQSFGIAISPHEDTSAQLSFFTQYGQTRLFDLPTVDTVSTNGRVTLGEPLVGNEGFAFTLQRLYW